MIYILGILYILFPMLITPLLIIAAFFDKKHSKLYIYGLILNLAIIGYHFLPGNTSDLYAHFQDMKYMEDMTLDEFFSYINSNDNSLFIREIWFYIVSITNNYSFLPFSAILITYGIITKDIFNFGKKESIPNSLIVLSILSVIILWALIWPMSGIRSSVVLVLFLHGLFREFVLNKRNLFTYLFYLVPIFIHYSVVILLIIRLGISFHKKYIKWLAFLLLLTWSFFINEVLLLLSKFNLSYADGLIKKINLYDDFFNDSRYMIATFIIKIIFCIIIILSYYFLKKNYTLSYLKYENLYNFSLWLALFCFGGISNFIIIDRYGYLVLALLPFLLMPLIMKSKSKYFYGYCLTIVFPLFIIFGLYINYVPLKSTSYDLTLYEILSRNLISLFF